MNWSLWPFDRLFRDLRYASRSLAKTPAFTTAAILTLAVGIGANTAIFSALDGVVLKPLPYREPDRLADVALFNRSLNYATNLSYPDFLDWQRDTRSFEQMAAYKPVGLNLTNPGSPEHVAGYEISSGFFSTLGVNLALGSSFSEIDDQIGGRAAVVISNRMWKARFNSDSAAIGKSITLDGTAFTIVGVLPDTFRFEEIPADVYTSIGRPVRLYPNDRTVHDTLCVARLAPGVSLSQAQAQMNTLQDHIDERNPATEKGLATSVTSLKGYLVGNIGSTLRLLLGAVGLVLVIACANVANLLLARSAARTREFAVRRALGASRAQLVQQSITESVLLSLSGGIVGLLVAKVGLRAVLAAVPGSLPRSENIAVNASVLLFTLVTSATVGMLFGLVPALKLANTDLQGGLTAGGRGSRGSISSHQRAQGILAVAQIALALVLLSGAGLLFRTIHNLWAVNPGFDTQHVITFKVGLSASMTDTPAATRAAFQQLTERVRRIPGITSSDLTALVPLGRGDNSGPFWFGPRPPASMAEIPRALYYAIGPDYPRTLQIPLLRGRYLTQGDNVSSELVALVDSQMARTYFPGSDPVGQSLTFPHWGNAGPSAFRVVGVVGHVAQYGIDGSKGEKPQIYYSFYQLPDEGMPIFRDEITFAVRTALAPANVIPEIKNAVYGASGNEPIYDVSTMIDLVSGSMARQRFTMIMLVAFAALALFLSTVGIYGVISYATTQRVPEIGMRIALGATKGNVQRMLIGRGLRLAFAGVVIGAVSTLVLTRVVSGFSRLLYGVRGTDPLTFLAVSLCLFVAAVLACYIPARRAAQLDPMTALRHE